MLVYVDETKEMYGRVVVPIYDDNYEYVVGVAGRSIFEIHTCGMYHNPKKINAQKNKT